MKRFVLGDIHGANQALVQVLERSSFDPKNDLLICLGDVCDGWPETKEAITTLLKIKNLVYILGNHDYWALEWALSGESPEIWLSQGGEATIKSYHPSGMPQEHIKLLSEAPYYHILDNKLFVHAGIDPRLPVEVQETETLLWDRELYKKALSARLSNQTSLTPYEEVYIGHSPIHYYSMKPIQACEIWLMDTGAGWDGVLSIMNIDTKEPFVSDYVSGLYPMAAGRL